MDVLKSQKLRHLKIKCKKILFEDPNIQLKFSFCLKIYLTEVTISNIHIIIYNKYYF